MGAGSSMEGPRTLWDIRWRWIATTAWALAACAGPPTAPAVPTHEGFVFGYVQDLTGHPVIGIRVRVRTGCRPSAAACGMPAPRVVEGDTVTEALVGCMRGLDGVLQDAPPVQLNPYPAHSAEQ